MDHLNNFDSANISGAVPCAELSTSPGSSPENTKQLEPRDESNPRDDSGIMTMDTTPTHDCTKTLDKNNSEAGRLTDHADDASIVTCVCEPITVNMEEDLQSLNINHLPADVLDMIFSYFTKVDLCRYVAPVCKVWRDMAYNPIHWRVLKLDKVLTYVQLLSILKRASLLSKFCLHQDTFNSMLISEVDNIIRQCPGLTELHIICAWDNIMPMDHVLTFVQKHCASLNYIALPGYCAMNSCGIDTLCEMKELKAVNIAHCDGFVRDKHIAQISHALPDLKELNIDGNSHITDWSISQLVLDHKDSLSSLTLDGERLSDDSILCLSGCTNLHTLSISFCEALTDSALTALKTMKKLRCLRLRKGNDFTAEKLQELFGDDGLSNLTHLELSECLALDDRGVSALAESCGCSLIDLKLCWCWEVTDLGVDAIVRNCRKLVCLSLQGLDQITGQSMADIPQFMPYLRELDCSQCHKIREEIILKVIEQQPSLKALDYYGEQIGEDC